jgi:hypothetical protein
MMACLILTTRFTVVVLPTTDAALMILFSIPLVNKLKNIINATFNAQSIEGTFKHPT